MNLRHDNFNSVRIHRGGLVLLVVLGMLALFSLLAISYLTISSQSRNASEKLVRAKLQKPATNGLDVAVVTKIIHGDTNNQSAFFGHSLLEDIYGRDPIRGQYDPSAGSAVLSSPGNVGILKVQLSSNIVVNPDPLRNPSLADENSPQSALSIENDTYTGRIITFLEGPLANQSYRILGYIGSPALDNAGAPLPNFDYSIAIDLGESVGSVFTANITKPGTPPTVTSLSGSLQDWLQYSSNDPSIFTSDNGVGYRYLINDLPFNGVGYGVEGNSTLASFGNLDQSRLVTGTRIAGVGYQPGYESLPIALLPNYDYLKASSSGSIGQGQINSAGPFYDVVGSSNEGFDVADYRDYWLSRIPPESLMRQGNIIPSYHRPELVNYIAQYYAELVGNSITAQQIARMVQLIDYACARPLSYRLVNCPLPNCFSKTLIEKNVDFSGRSDAYAIPTLDIDLSNLVTARAELQIWVKALIGGGNGGASDAFAWDVDNDGDGVADSVWVDPNMPLVTSPEGRHLKILTAPLIVDLDGRLNINATGDPYQSWLRNNTYRTTAESGADTGFIRTAVANPFLPQGLGYGPAEISLGRLFFGNRLPSFLDMRYGNDRDPGNNLFHVPGKFGQERIGQYFQQREVRYDATGFPYGLKQARRGTIAYGTDRIGNPRMSESVAGTANELVDDAYEVNLLNASSGDALVTLEEMETLLRRYDTDASNLPDRLRNVFSSLPINDIVFSSLTSRSVELRYPNMAALARHSKVYSNRNYASPPPPLPFPRKNSLSGNYTAVPVGNVTTPRLIANGRTEGSFMRWVQMLFDERYPGGVPLNIEDIRELFPLEFRQALRMDLNRPFGNGADDDTDGIVDEPEELASNQIERYPTSGADVTANGTYYTANFPPKANDATQGNIPTAIWNQFFAPQMSRKMFARQLYVLAQLLVEPNYPFAGFVPADAEYGRMRARALAQWAVNVVDFRDSDAAMTRFEYDETPFVVDTGDTSVWNPKNDNVVWGMEFPELLMTETLAFHDKRVKDTSADSTTKDTKAFMNPDDDFDQYRIPQGSAFIEFYCPRSPNSPTTPASAAARDRNLGAAPSNLYDVNGELIVSKVLPQPSTPFASSMPFNADYGYQPVFRVGIAKIPAGQDPGTFVAAAAANNPQSLANYKLLHQFTNQTSVAGTQSTAFSGSGLVSFVGTSASNSFPTMATSLKFDRILWFSGANVGANQSIPDLYEGEDPSSTYFNERPHRIFRSGSGAVTLGGGQYLVVGPRANSPLGSLNSGASPPIYEPSLQSVGMVAGNVTLTTLGNNTFPASGFPIQPPRTMIAIAEPPNATWLQPTATSGPAPLLGGVGFNISEPTPSPTRYYSMPTTQLNEVATPAFPRSDSWANLNQGQTSLVDAPFDNDNTAVLERLAAENKQRPGTYALHRTAYLQRVADPDLPYHPLYNPYITIDWMNMDLTVFNGEDIEPVDDPTRVDGSGNPAPYVAPTDEKENTTIGFAVQSRYKDGARVSDAPNTQDIVTPTQAATSPGPRYTFTDPTISDTQTGLSIFSSSTAFLIKSTPQATIAGAPPYFKYALGVFDPNNPIGAPSVTLGYLNVGREDSSNRFDGFGDPSTVAGNYRGSPQLPQAGLFWANRPFASPYEIMLVPTTGPGQLGHFFTTPKNLVAADLAQGYATGQYDIAARPGNAVPVPWITPFGYLPNFFSSPPSKVANTATPYEPFWQQRETPPPANPGSSWNLLLELIETPPVYGDGKRWINPNQLNASNNIEAYLLGTRVAPFNFASEYRVPGKVNVNTIQQQPVWDSIEFNYDVVSRMGGNTSMNLTALGNSTVRWGELQSMRQGYSTSPGNSGSFFGNAIDRNVNLDAFVPTQFRGAFRSPFSANIEVANQPGITIPPYANMPTSETMRHKHSAYTGLNRPNEANSNDGTLFGPNLEALRGLVGIPATDAQLAAELSRSPFSYYQRLMRLPNLVTNQSNVFAVWVTVGLFEYDEVTGIGAEYFGPSGTPDRTKSFYMIDRSIPVGFEPGKSLNSDRTILLQRKIPR